MSRRNSTVRLLLSVIVIALAPAPALANIIVPTFVQCITSPFPWCIFVLPLIISVPVLLGISAIEALVARRYARETRFRTLVKNLIFINIITSLIGTVTMPTGTELWPGFLIYYGLTVITEALLLVSFGTPMGLPRSMRSHFLISLRMNTASYAVLGIILAGLIYGPQIGNESSAVRSAAQKGTVVLVYGDRAKAIDLSAPRLAVESSEPGLESGGRLPRTYALSADGQIAALMDGKLVKLRSSGKAWLRDTVSLPPHIAKPCGLSPDGRLICCTVKDKPVVYDLVGRQVVLELGQTQDRMGSADFSRQNLFVAVKQIEEVHLDRATITYRSLASVVNMKTGRTVSLGEAYALAFNPADDRLAWKAPGGITVRDCATGRQKTLRVPGSIDGGLAWSPDGRLLAYVGHPNPFTASAWNPDVRAVDSETGKSVTLYRGVFTGGRPCWLFWTR